MTTPTLKDVIERLEEARAGSYDLDEMVAFALYGPPVMVRLKDAPASMPDIPMYLHDDGVQGTALRVTQSLDGALALVPKGWSWSVAIDEHRLHPVVRLGRSHPTNRTVAQEGATPALALCIAALKCRLSLQTEGK